MTSSTESSNPTPASPDFLGDEMTGWRDGIDPPTALTEWVAAVLEQGHGSVLLVGPRAAALARRIGSRADVLVRGTIDAARLRAEGANVRCGGLDRLPAGASYDTVVLLDGPERVFTRASPGLGYLNVLDLAVAHADGQFIAYVANALAASPLSQSRASGDNSWWMATPGYDSRAPVRPELPEPPARVVLGDAAIVDSRHVGEPLTATTMRAALVGQQHWLDVIDAGAARALATGWVLVRGTELPDLATVFAPTLPTPSGTAGEPLEVLLIDALRRSDLHRAGALVSRYADLVRVLPEVHRSLAVPRNVVRTPEGALTLRIDPATIDPAGKQSPSIPSVSAAVAHGLLDLAALLTGAAHHPYRPELDALGVAKELGASLDLDDDAWRHGEKVRYSVGLPVRHIAPEVSTSDPARGTVNR